MYRLDDDMDMAEGSWRRVSEEVTSADKLSAAIQGGNEKEFIRLLKGETSDLQNFRDSVSKLISYSMIPGTQ